MKVFSSNHLKLNNIDAAVKSLRVHDNLHVQCPLFDDSLDSRETDPKVVCIKYVEFLHGFEVLDFFLWDLGHFQKPQMILILDQGAALHVSPGLVCNLHDELRLCLDAEVEDRKINCGPEIIDVG